MFEVIINSVFAGISIVLFFVNFYLAYKNFDRKISAYLAITAILLVSYFSAVLYKYLATYINQYITGEKWLNASIILAGIPFSLFIKEYFDYRKRRLLYPLLGGYLLIFVVNIIEPLGFNFHNLSLPAGKEIEVYMSNYILRDYAQQSFWTDVLVFILVLNMIYLFLAIYNGFRKGKVRESYIIIIALLVIIISNVFDLYITDIREELSYIFIIGFITFRVLRGTVNIAKIKEELTENQQYRSLIVTNISDVIFTLTPDLKVIFVSESIKNYQIKANEILNENLFSVISSDYKIKLEESKEKAVKKNKKVSLICKFNKPELNALWIEVSFDPIIKGGICSQIICVIRNVTKTKQLLEDLKTAKESAEKSERLKTEFLAQISHEVRTPVSTILNYTQLLKEDIRNNILDDIEQYFSSINSASDRLIRTIDLILNLSEIQTKSYNPIFKEIHLKNDVLLNLYREFKPEALRKGLEFNLVCETDKLKIAADKFSIEQIFSNLISNAIKFTVSGTVEVKIFRNSEDILCVIIKDTGIGIKNEHLEDIFKPFRQVEQGYTRTHEGNGLGLTLVKEYCTINKARISVRSQENVGSQFTIEFSNSN